jgi:cold shock protein
MKFDRSKLMPTGTVKWFNPTKGYGFIQPQGGGKDVFVHISAVERAGLSGLNEGQAIEFELVSNRGKTSAENLRVRWSSVKFSIFRPIEGRPRHFEPPGI